MRRLLALVSAWSLVGEPLEAVGAQPPAPTLEPAVEPETEPPDDVAPEADAPPEPSAAEQADALLDRAQALLADNRHDEARLLLDEAYRLDPRPSLLWARAQAARWANDCVAAIDLYEQYEAAGPSAADLHRARANAERCRATLAEAGVAIAPEPEPESESEPVAPPPDPAPPAEARRRLAPGVGLLATGSAVFVAGGALVGIGASTTARAGMAPTEEDFGRRLSASRIELGVGGALCSVGLGLATWGIIRLVRHRSRRGAR